MIQMRTFRVIDNLTGKEAEPFEIVIHEQWANELMFCDLEGFAVLEDGSLILADECGNFEYCPIGRFTVEWESGEQNG